MRNTAIALALRLLGGAGSAFAQSGYDPSPFVSRVDVAAGYDYIRANAPPPVVDGGRLTIVGFGEGVQFCSKDDETCFQRKPPRSVHAATVGETNLIPAGALRTLSWQQQQRVRDEAERLAPGPFVFAVFPHRMPDDRDSPRR